MEPENSIRKMIRDVLPESCVGDTYASSAGDYLVMASVSGSDIIISVFRAIPSSIPTEAFMRLNVLNNGIASGAHAIQGGYSSTFYRYHTVIAKDRLDDAFFRRCVDAAIMTAEKGYRFILKGV